jgi:protein arginine kinase activator
MGRAGRYDTAVKCDRCDNEATVHEVRIEAGKRREKHLCEQCARAEGVAATQVSAPLTTLLSNFMLQQGDAAPAPTAQSQAAAMTTPCVSCGTTYAKFRDNGLLGCPTCYSQFENQLVPLLARAHEGGTSHTGKTPRRLAGAVPPSGVAIAPKPAAPVPRPVPVAIDPQAVAKLLKERVTMLKKRLAEAIASEAYEKAAKLRDELAHLEGTPQTGTLPPPPAPAKRKPRSPGERPPHSPDHPEAPESGDAEGSR